MKDENTETVEKYLRDERASNLRQKIWPSNNVVIDRLLQDSDNLCDAWGELLTLCPCGSYAQGRTHENWQMVLRAIVDVAAGWSPERVKSTRQAIQEVSDLTSEIQKNAAALAELLRKRSRVCEMNAISKSPSDIHPVDLFGPAAEISDRHESLYGDTHCRFMSFIDEPLKKLDYQFDLKYWPRTADVVEAIAEAQYDAAFSVDDLSEAAISVRQASNRDFMRALDKALSELSDFDIAITFSHASYAAIVNAALGLNQTESAQAECARTVKKYRSDERKRAG